MTTIITLTGYSFSELSDKAKERALSELSDINTGYEWWDCTEEDWKEKLETLGYENPELAFNGFWSQGDGASFTGSIDILQWLKSHKACNHYRKLYNAIVKGDDYISGCIKRDKYHHYVHWNTVSVYLDLESESDELDHLVSELQDEILDEVRRLSRQYYDELKSKYIALTSEEAIIETIEANEYLFDAWGNLRPTH